MNKVLYFLLILITIISCNDKKEVKLSEKDIVDKTQEISPVLTQKWVTDTILKTPESVIFNSKLGVYYISCIGAVPPEAKDKDGYISKVDQQGNILKDKWITGLSGPKGMGIKGDSLYVTDIDALVIINISNSKVVKRIPVKGAKFLNDIDISSNGTIYFSDTYTNTLHSFDGKDVKVILANEALGNPNGIFVVGDKLVMSSFGKSQVYTIDLAKPEVEVKTDSLQGGDGVEAYKDGYLVSNWNGEIYFVDKNWKKHLLIDTKAVKRNAADIEFVASQNMLIVPEFFANRVTAYEIK